MVFTSCRRSETERRRSYTGFEQHLVVKARARVATSSVSAVREPSYVQTFQQLISYGRNESTAMVKTASRSYKANSRAQDQLSQRHTQIAELSGYILNASPVLLAMRSTLPSSFVDQFLATATINQSAMSYQARSNQRGHWLVKLMHEKAFLGGSLQEPFQPSFLV